MKRPLLTIGVAAAAFFAVAAPTCVPPDQYVDSGSSDPTCDGYMWNYKPNAYAEARCYDVNQCIQYRVEIESWDGSFRNVGPYRSSGGLSQVWLQSGAARSAWIHFRQHPDCYET